MLASKNLDYLNLDLDPITQTNLPLINSFYPTNLNPNSKSNIAINIINGPNQTNLKTKLNLNEKLVTGSTIPIINYQTLGLDKHINNQLKSNPQLSFSVSVSVPSSSLTSPIFGLNCPNPELILDPYVTNTIDPSLLANGTPLLIGSTTNQTTNEVPFEANKLNSMFMNVENIDNLPKYVKI